MSTGMSLLPLLLIGGTVLLGVVALIAVLVSSRKEKE